MNKKFLAGLSFSLLVGAQAHAEIEFENASPPTYVVEIVSGHGQSDSGSYGSDSRGVIRIETFTWSNYMCRTKSAQGKDLLTYRCSEDYQQLTRLIRSATRQCPIELTISRETSKVVKVQSFCNDQ